MIAFDESLPKLSQRHLALGDISEPVSVLLPVCNECDGIEGVLAELVEVVFRHLPEGSEFLIAEGGSTDGTKGILRELNERWPFLQVTYADKKEGFAHAAAGLYRRARCPLIFFADSDGQCVASEFWKLALHVNGSDFVLGVKQVRYDPLVRRLASKTFNWIARRLFHTGLKDINFGFRLCRREAALACLDECRYMRTHLNAEIALVAHRRHFRISQVQVHHRPRLYGDSRGLEPSRLLGESWRALVALLKLRSDHTGDTGPRVHPH